MVTGFRMVLILADGSICGGTGMRWRREYTDSTQLIIFYFLLLLQFIVTNAICSFIWLFYNKNLRKNCITEVRYMKSVNCTIMLLLGQNLYYFNRLFVPVSILLNLKHKVLNNKTKNLFMSIRSVFQGIKSHLKLFFFFTISYKYWSHFKWIDFK